MTTGNTDASVTLTFRVREQVSTSMNRVESSLQRVQTTAARTTKVLAQNSLQMVAVGSAMVAGAGGASDLAVKFGLLTEEQGKSTRSFIQGAGAVVAIAGGLAQLGTLSINVSRALGVSAAGFSGFAAVLTKISIAATSALLAINAIKTTLKGEAGDPGGIAGAIVDRIPQVRAPSAVRRLANTPVQDLVRQAAGEVINVHVTTFAATETELRGAAKAIGRILQEEARIGGFKLP